MSAQAGQAQWAITACTYVVAASRAATVERVRRRILGTFIGVPIGLAVLPLTTMAALLVWSAAALAMVVYAMALPDRYDIACGAFAFALIVTLAVGGEHSVPLLAARPGRPCSAQAWGGQGRAFFHSGHPTKPRPEVTFRARGFWECGAKRRGQLLRLRL